MHAIRPAYIVLAGLGAGNILLVIIAVVIICSYPLNISQMDKNAINGGLGGGGAVGGGGVEHHEMTNKHREDEDDFPDNGYIDHQPQQPQSQSYAYNDENEINKRYTAHSYDDEPPVNVEENPYFNKTEIEASAAF